VRSRCIPLKGCNQWVCQQSNRHSQSRALCASSAVIRERRCERRGTVLGQAVPSGINVAVVNAEGVAETAMHPR
jgi:hypothetical protein